MIASKKDYNYYLEADRLALGIARKRPLLFFDEVWRFERLLRKVEYYKNCKKSALWKPYYYLLYFFLHRAQIKLGFYIHPNCFGAGLSISHPGTIIVNGNARIGSNCRLHDCVVIGTEAGYSDRAPTIGDNVYIGPGAKIYGKIMVANGVAIGANSVVNKSIDEPNVTVAGVPAKKVSNSGSKGLIIEATDLIKNMEGGV